MIEIINKSFMLVYFICLLFYGSKQNVVLVCFFPTYHNIMHRHIFDLCCFVNQ